MNAAPIVHKQCAKIIGTKKNGKNMVWNIFLKQSVETSITAIPIMIDLPLQHMNKNPTPATIAKMEPNTFRQIIYFPTVGSTYPYTFNL